MPNQLESIPQHLGRLREGLIGQGYDTTQAFQIVLELIRRGETPLSLFE